MDIIIETPRLYLRRFTQEDAPLILELDKDPEIKKYLHEPSLKNITGANKILTDIILPQYKNNFGRLAVHVKGSDIFMGWCGLKYVAWEDEVDIGYRLMPKFWGNGYATEAASFSVDHGFKNLDLKKIIGRSHIDNIASIKVLQKIGMIFIQEEVYDNCPIKKFDIESSSLHEGEK